MTRLFYTHNIAMPGPEANTVNVAKMCSAFAANGCEVTLGALSGAPGDDLQARVRDHYDLSETFEVVALPASAARPSMAALAGAVMARRRNADIAYTRAPHVGLATCLAGIPTVLEVHADLPAFGKIGRAAFRRALRHPQLRKIVVISNALERRLRHQAPEIGPDLIVVAHDGADLPGAFPTTPTSERLSVGYVARFYRGKGLDIIARTATLCPWADFHIVGGDAAEAAHFAGCAMPANVTCYGSVPHAAVARLIDGWDVVLAPYQRSVLVADGKTDTASWMSPLKVFEYMAAGKAMLASDLPALREVLTDNETALLIPPDDASAWAKAVTRLRDHPALRRRLAEGARATFSRHYSWTERARRILEASVTPLGIARGHWTDAASYRPPPNR
jgi:glycosyltransferase involved in cell wall biosynthesis